MTEAPPEKIKSSRRMMLEVFWSVVVGAGIVGLLVAVLAPFIEEWIRDGVAQQGVEGFWVPILRWALVILVGLAVVAALVLLAISLFRSTWRAKVWTPVARFIRDTWPVRSSTHRRGVHEADGAGYARRSAEVDAERASTPQPAWRIEFGDSHFGVANIHWLYNWGYQARDTSLTCDAEYFVLDGEPFFIGNFDAAGMGGTGKQFRGMPTPKGIAEGVDFVVAWRDINGDERHRTVHVPPEDIRLGRDAVAEHARQEGYHEGYEKGYEKGSAVQAPANSSGEDHVQNPAAAPTAPMSKERRLEIIDHKARQVQTERQVLIQMMGKSTDDAIINQYLDGMADLDAREAQLKAERFVVEMGDKVVRPPKKS